MKQIVRLVLCLLLTLLAFACADETEPSTEPVAGGHDLPDFGEDGKADNYISTNAREYTLSGQAHVVLPEDFESLSEEEQDRTVERLIQTRSVVLNRSLKRHVDEVVSDANNGVTGEDARYFTFYKRDNDEQALVGFTDDNRAIFSFEMELIGSTTLMSKVAPGSGKRTFEINVRDYYDANDEGEAVEVEIEGSPSRDAFPKYDALFEDGVFDIAIHFGGDYNEERFDIDTAEWTVEYLLGGGWDNASVTSFDDLKIDSPAFTRTVLVEGKEIEARVRVFHSDMVEPTDESLLSEAMRESFQTADIVMYSGHAGPNAGFILDYQPRHEIRASEFASLPLADKYQVYVFDGCQTYRTYVDDLIENPAKTWDNLDVVTTVNTTPFSVGYQVIHEFLYWFTITDEAGIPYPLSWKTILRGINTEEFRSVHYGVHGIDNDPQLNPHASEGVACTPCSTDSECGAGGNLCLNYGGGGACGVACTTDTACGEGYRCARLYDDPDFFYIPKQCVRRDYVCE